MKFERGVEEEAMRREFRALCDRWSLSDAEIEGLLGQGVVQRERAMRTVLTLDCVLRDLPFRMPVEEWLRAPDPVGSDPNPLSFMSRGSLELGAMLEAARRRRAGFESGGSGGPV
ncbi:hypothetical protein P8R33_05060 [Qipengyuania sp. XHP0211]|uniref:hypothetical protein n=1 Tax=Qipengyuania sp. XHP0211 TaxID=3038079 RepID=UPI00241C4FD8|nr:hypothetical protein [Qipengyuania sp. XHP0211]MDG5750468.1 hypothetical protein [Qipengyuania sp. XHP0211]